MSATKSRTVSLMTESNSRAKLIESKEKIDDSAKVRYEE